jgi:hypothetical protein
MAVDSPDSVVAGRQNWSLPKVRVTADDAFPSAVVEIFAKIPPPLTGSGQSR